jgi:urea transport system ATP-binding protein
MSKLHVSTLNQYYGGSHILWDIELHVPKGSCTCIMGRNGVGKTTLLKSIMGLLPVRSGTIRFESAELATTPPEGRARLGMGYVPQGREIFASLSVEENLVVGVASANKRTRQEIIERVLSIFPALRSMLRRRGGDLSGGQQQQLAVARALAVKPSLLILDEPTEGIQPNVVQELGDTVMKLNREQGLTVLLVEQKLGFARKVADRFCILDRGRSVASGAMADLDDTLIQRHLAV